MKLKNIQIYENRKSQLTQQSVGVDTSIEKRQPSMNTNQRPRRDISQSEKRLDDSKIETDKMRTSYDMNSSMISAAENSAEKREQRNDTK